MRTVLAAVLGMTFGFMFWVPVSYVIAFAFYLLDSEGGAAHEVADRVTVARDFGTQVLLPGDWFSLASLVVFLMVGGLVGARYAQTVGAPVDRPATN
jgi:hypothetical protein